jgi:hypothetical protein
MSERTRRWMSISLVTSIACVGACGGSTKLSGAGGSATGGGQAAGTGGNGAGGSPPGTGGAGGTGGADGGFTASCPGWPGYGGAPAPTPFASASGTIVDLTGAPAPNVFVEVSGLDLAMSSRTSASGSFTVSLDHTLMKPMLKFGDSLAWAELAVPVTMATTAFGNLTTGAMPAVGAPFVPGGAAVSAGVTLSLPAGATATIDMLSYSTPDQQLFRIVQIPVEKEAAVPGVAEYAFVLLFGATPLDTQFCPAATITVPNNATPPLPANSAVEFWGLGLDVGQAWAPFGDWAKLSDGQVSADGTTIATAPNQGFAVLETFAVRSKT